MTGDLRQLEAALRRGVTAVVDERRVGFYVVEVGDDWYYIHMAKHAPKVYLVAVHSSVEKVGCLTY